jgi:hypothetical protein
MLFDCSFLQQPLGVGFGAVDMNVRATLGYEWTGGSDAIFFVHKVWLFDFTNTFAHARMCVLIMCETCLEVSDSFDPRGLSKELDFHESIRIVSDMSLAYVCNIRVVDLHRLRHTGFQAF